MLTQTHTYNFPSGEAPFTHMFDLDLFDSNLGELLGVKVTLNATSQGEVSVYNPSTTTTRSFTAVSVAVPLTVTGPASTSVAFNLVATYNPGSAVSIAPRETLDYSGIPGSGTSDTVVSSGNFGSYQAAGGGISDNAIVVTSTEASASGTGSPGLLYGGTASAFGSVVVEYTYNQAVPEVPEPGTYALLGSGLVAFGLYRRRRA